jgi:hypothetical protein
VALNFVAGLQLADRRFHAWVDPDGPFMSLSEMVVNPDSFSSVFAWTHDRLRDSARVERVWTRPMWLQTVHTRNLANELKGIPISSGGARRDFTLRVAGEPSSPRIHDQVRAAVGIARRTLRSSHRLGNGLRLLTARP